MSLDALDRKLVNRLQDGIEPVSRPFAALSRELGLSEDEIVSRLARLRESGVLTRFGPMFDAARMGGAYCLCAMIVPEERFAEVTDAVNAFDEVAHNYRREHRFNMWFVLATENDSGIGEAADAIEAKTGIKVYRFPKEAEFFIELKVPA
jgi:DNA-binding Lrp family transcriptional regulator